MTTENLDMPLVAVQAGVPPHPLQKLWSGFRANRGAVLGSAVIVTVGASPNFAAGRSHGPPPAPPVSCQPPSMTE